MALRLGKPVFDQRIVEMPKDQRPGDNGHTCGIHLQRMDQLRSLVVCHHLEPMTTVKSARSCEPKLDAPAGLIRDNRVANGAVAANGAYLQWTVKTHSRPRFVWPEHIGRGRETVEQRCHCGGRSLKRTAVNIANEHGGWDAEREAAAAANQLVRA